MLENASRRRRPSRQERTAHHEAGHAVIADMLDLGFTHITIVPDSQTGSLGSTGYVRASEPITNLSDVPWTRSDSRIIINTVKQVMKHVAGFAAESLLTKQEELNTESRDYSEALHFAGAICRGDEEAHAFIRWLFLRTRDQLGKWPTWDVVKALAARLLECKELRQDEAKRIIEKARQSALRSRLR